MDLPCTFHTSGWTLHYIHLTPPNALSKDLPTILFIHGTPWSSAVFAPLARALLTTGKYNVILYDLPGYGKSQDFTSSEYVSEGDDEAGERNTSIRAQATYLKSLLIHLELTPAALAPGRRLHVIAHDIAGSIALRAHLLHSRIQFASLLLLDTNCVLPWGDGFYTLCRSHPEVFTALPPHIFTAVLHAVIHSASSQTLSPHWLHTLASPWSGPTGQANFVRQIADANDGDVAEMLDRELYGTVRCDVRILRGGQDSWIPQSKLETLASLLPKERLKGLVEIPEAGHLVMLDQPERVMLEVVGWLAEQDSRDGRRDDGGDNGCGESI